MEDEIAIIYFFYPHILALFLNLIEAHFLPLFTQARPLFLPPPRPCLPCRMLLGKTTPGTLLLLNCISCIFRRVLVVTLQQFSNRILSSTGYLIFIIAHLYCLQIISSAASAQTPSALRSVGGMLGYAGVSSLNVLSSAAKTVPAAGAAVLGEPLGCWLLSTLCIVRCNLVSIDCLTLQVGLLQMFCFKTNYQYNMF